MARVQVPDDAWLWTVWSRADVDPDGRDASWSFDYDLPGGQELPDAGIVNLRVDGPKTFVFEALIRQVVCIPAQPLEPLDSRRRIHDAIRLLEDRGYTVRLGDTGTLNIKYGHDCSYGKLFLSYVTFSDPAAYFDSDGAVLGLILREAAFLV